MVPQLRSPAGFKARRGVPKSVLVPYNLFENVKVPARPVGIDFKTVHMTIYIKWTHKWTHK